MSQPYPGAPLPPVDPAAVATPAPAADPRITKFRVTMRNAVIGADGNVHTHEAVDYVRPDFLDAYVAAARGNWQSVVVSDTPDAGPGGYDGETAVPAHLEHPLAGQLFPATGAAFHSADPIRPADADVAPLAPVEG